MQSAFRWRVGKPISNQNLWNKLIISYKYFNSTPRLIHNRRENRNRFSKYFLIQVNEHKMGKYKYLNKTIMLWNKTTQKSVASTILITRNINNLGNSKFRHTAPKIYYQIQNGDGKSIIDKTDGVFVAQLCIYFT